ncbi:MAG: lamin tail domain-containing protein, partial [Deltaproteobacteria bacterium]|nr:lamin tail domain-containing protein [Deltaproteobacteria bacterium]
MGRLLTGLLVTGLLLGVPGSATAAVVINELAYHPLGNDPGAEFLELHNTGGTPVDLDGWCIDGIGICFEAGDTIAAGGYLVLARDAAVFLAIYKFAADHEYPGELGNEGDALILEDASLVVVDELVYSDLAPWPVTPDGLGPSLELIDA